MRAGVALLVVWKMLKFDCFDLMPEWMLRFMTIWGLTELVSVLDKSFKLVWCAFTYLCSGESSLSARFVTISKIKLLLERWGGAST